MKDDEIKNKILVVLHRYPMIASVKMVLDILAGLKITIQPFDIYKLAKQLEIEGLVKYLGTDDKDFSIEITHEGYEVIELYGDYLTFKLNKKNRIELDKEVGILNIRYLRLKTWSIVITIFSTIISFIVGVLLSDPVKELLHKI